MFSFSKDIVTKYSLSKDQTLDKGILYQLFDKKQLVGQFILSNPNIFFSSNSKRFFVDNKSLIFDEQNSIAIGQYKYSNWTIFTGYRDKMFWHNDEYQLKKVKPDTRYSIFNKESWGQFKFHLTGANGKVVYKFKIDIPTVSVGNPYLNKPFSGEIEIIGVETIIALAGLRLIEKAIENESLLAE
jgi:hypothetical protein